MALCFCWAYRTGQWLARTEPLKIKKHGRFAKSIFRHGLDHLRCILCNQDCMSHACCFYKALQAFVLYLDHGYLLCFAMSYSG